MENEYILNCYVVRREELKEFLNEIQSHHIFVQDISRIKRTIDNEIVYFVVTKRDSKYWPSQNFQDDLENKYGQKL